MKDEAPEMLVRLPEADVSRIDEVLAVIVLPRRVVVRLAEDVPVTEVKPAILIDGRAVKLPAVTARQGSGGSGEDRVVVLEFDFTRHLLKPDARLQIWIHGFLMHEQPLVELDGPISGQIEGVQDGHLIGWAANLQGGSLPPFALHIDGVKLARIRPVLTDHEMCRYAPRPACAGFRIKLPPQAVDGAQHSLMLRIGETWLPELAWPASRSTLPAPVTMAQPLRYDIVDTEYYVSLYSDIAEVLSRNPDFDVADHFWDCGIDEGRLPSISFDIEYVQHKLRKIHDLDLDRRATVQHFFSRPAASRFVPNRWFSAAMVRALHPDVAGDLGDYELFDFYMANAAALLLSPGGLFDEAAYRRRHADIDRLIEQGRFRSGFHHFMVAGWREGRQNLPGFGQGLIAPDARGREERDTLFHRFGELRPLVPWFDETFYLDVYPDVRERKRRGEVQSGLEHFLVLGCREGRLPHPGLLASVRRSGGDIATLRQALEDGARPAADRLLSLEEGADLYAYLSADPIARDPRRLSQIVWATVGRPWLNGSFNAERYLAANPDLAQLFGNDRRRAADHWRTDGIREGRPAPGSNLFAERALLATDLLRGGTGVNLIGPLSLPTGLGAAARGYVDALRQAGVRVDTYDVSGLLHAGELVEVFAPSRMRHSINLVFLNPDQVLPLAARFGTQLFDHRVNVGLWVWELPTARPEWRSTFACFDLVITPSDFCTNAFDGETDARVVTVPYVVDRDRLLAHLAQFKQNRWIDVLETEKQRGRKVVLFIMDASSYTIRKGTDVFLKVAERIEATRPGRFVFVLKTHSRDHFGAERERLPDNVVLIDEIFAWPDLCKLKQTADLFISPHRSEGFGLNIFESLVLGVPVICSPFGGGPDALPADFPFFIGGKLKEVGASLGPYRSSAIWFDPDPESAAERLLAFFDDEEANRTLFRELAADVSARLSAARVGATLCDLLARHCGLGLNQGPLAELFERSRAECFDIEMDHALSDGSQSVSAMVQNCLQPRFSVITPTWNSDPEWLQDIYRDLCGQKLQSWEWCVCDDGSTRPETIATLTSLRARDARVKLHLSPDNQGISHATNHAVRISCGQYVVFVDHDDRVSPDLLSAYAAAIADGAGDGPDVLYCDEDKLFGDGGRRDHYFKPDWSPEHLLSTMYVLHCLCVRKSVFLATGGYRSDFGGAQDHDFLLRATSAGARVRHVDQVLYHWRVSNSSAALFAGAKPYAEDAGRRAVADHLARMKLHGTVESGLLPGTYRIRPAIAGGLVSLNILTSCTKRIDDGSLYVANLVRSILAHDTGQEIEIRVVVDAGAMAAAKPLARLDPRVKIVRFDRGDEPFNFSEKANFAVRSSQTDRVVLMNDDMEAIDGAWLGALLELLELPGVGVVSGRLLHGDDTVQHSGIVLGVNGAASHVFVGTPDDFVGYNAFTHVIRNYSAVTGALMAFRRGLFDRVGGFDPEFPIDFNDVDFCLRVQEAGQRIVFTPFARMRHFESRSAVRLAADSYDEHRFSGKWRRVVDHDPYYNRNLRRDASMFEAAGYV